MKLGGIQRNTLYVSPLNIRVYTRTYYAVNKIISNDYHKCPIHTKMFLVQGLLLENFWFQILYTYIISLHDLYQVDFLLLNITQVSEKTLYIENFDVSSTYDVFYVATNIYKPQNSLNLFFHSKNDKTIKAEWHLCSCVLDSYCCSILQ